jgi:hypothetical protein
MAPRSKLLWEFSPTLPFVTPEIEVPSRSEQIRNQPNERNFLAEIGQRSLLVPLGWDQHIVRSNSTFANRAVWKAATPVHGVGGRIADPGRKRLSAKTCRSADGLR